MNQEPSEETERFIEEHMESDVSHLALQANRYPGVDIRFAIRQIQGRQALRKKVPAWSMNPDLHFPERHLPLEQCSSQLSAEYKRTVIDRITGPCGRLVDLTGGLGVDFCFLARSFQSSVYVERQEELCDIMRHNAPRLGLNHVTCIHQDSVLYLDEMEPADWIILDPARRTEGGGKVFRISDCEPDARKLEEKILEKAQHVMIKLSPMLDVTQALEDLHHVLEVFIVSVHGECKETLIVLERGHQCPAIDIPIVCCHLHEGKDPFELTFTRKEERETSGRTSGRIGQFIYEAGPSIMKAGCHKTLCKQLGIMEISPVSHLYTSDQLIKDFPGRTFLVEEVCPFNRSTIKELGKTIKQANITTRNFPLSSEELRKRIGCKDGGARFLLATTTDSQERIIIVCSKV